MSTYVSSDLPAYLPDAICNLHSDMSAVDVSTINVSAILPTNLSADLPSHLSNRRLLPA